MRPPATRTRVEVMSFCANAVLMNPSVAAAIDATTPAMLLLPIQLPLNPAN